MTPESPRIRWRAPLVAAALAASLGLLQGSLTYVSLRSETGLTFQPSLRGFVLWQVSSWMVWALLAQPILAIARRVAPDRPARLLAVHLPVALVAGFVHSSADVLISRAIRPWGPGEKVALLDQIAGRFTNILYVELLVYTAIVGGSYAVDYYRRFRDRELRAAQLEASLSEARLETLRLQLQPHFLFNTLHTIAGLVRQNDNAHAVDMLAQLSDLLRAALDGGGRSLVPLREELALADRYLAIQQVRFADRLRLERDVDPAARDLAVPPFLLQPLLENAVRHGLAVRAGAGLLRIVALRDGDALRLEVHDDGSGPGAAAAKVEGVGLANSRARLAQLFGDAARLELLARAEGGAVARVTMPALELPAGEEHA